MRSRYVKVQSKTQKAIALARSHFALANYLRLLEPLEMRSCCSAVSQLALEN